MGSPERSSSPGRLSKASPCLLLLTVLVLIALGLCASPYPASAATQAQVSSANSQIQSAFVAVHGAEKSGGDVSSLVSQLNDAVSLVGAAQAENSTNPAQAAADLANATSIAQVVSAAAGPVGQRGASVRQAQGLLSVGSAAAIVVVAVMIYVYGDRVYRRAWLRLYGGYVVRKVG